MLSSHFVQRVITSFLLLIILWIPAFVGMTKDAFAAEEFATSYDVVYDITSDGVATVTEKITLRNLTSQYFANEFKLTIGATQIYDIVAYDDAGAMQISSEQKDGTTTIDVKFNQQVAGLNKLIPWTLQFKSKDFAEKIGKIWEVRSPKISTISNLENYNLTISVPVQFGEPTLISPIPRKQTVSSGKTYLVFDKEQIQSSGVLASFGKEQLFDFDLTYHLENPNLVPILTHIALPPDTAYQDVIYHRITPVPLNVTVDNDGNYLAWYRLTRGQKIDVKAIGSAKLYTSTKVRQPTLSDDLKRLYTQTDKYWEKDNPQITGKLTEILGTSPLTTTEEKAKSIYRFVVDSLKYDSSRISEDIERLGAVTTLNNASRAVCMEFTDLFIALARAANIPSRELDGYAYTANPTLRPLSLSKDVLHAWPEYFDEIRGWVMVDPTWENTTGGVDYFSRLDLNHFVFAIKGSSSTQPLAAGSYKFTGQDTNDVKVALTENDFLGKPQIDVKIEATSALLAGFPGKIKVKIANAGTALFPSNQFLISSQNLVVLGNLNPHTGPVPAFGTATFDFDVRTKSLFDSYSDMVTVELAGQKYTKEIIIKPFLGVIPLAVGILVVLILLLYIILLSGFIYRRKFRSG